jgi:hypothetical protein
VIALLALPGLAQDGLETWVGGGVSGGVQYFDSTGLTLTDATTTQAEVDGMVGWGWGHARVDLDLHFDPNLPTASEAVTAYPGPWPEWAMVQLGREKYHARLGIFNPNMGLEDWDPWINYAPTYSTNFVYAGAGRFLGGELSLTTDGAVDVFAFGGYDVDWEAVGGGVGVATAQDAFGTWSGLFVYPEFTVCPSGDSCLYLGAALAFEVYPADALWIDLDTVTGLRDGSFFTSEQLIVNIVPEAVVAPFVRAELAIDPDGVLGAPDATAGAGVRSDALDWLRIAAEGKALFYDGATDWGGALVLSVHRPEPLPYSYTDPFAIE